MEFFNRNFMWMKILDEERVALAFKQANNLYNYYSFHLKRFFNIPIEEHKLFVKTGNSFRTLQYS